MVFRIMFFIFYLQIGLGNKDPQKHYVYRGEKFPQNYLSVDAVKSTSKDFSLYVEKLTQVAGFFAAEPNNTDHSVALASYLMKAVLKRTMRDYDNKLKDQEKSKIKHIINQAEHMTSHYRYHYANAEKDELGYRMIGLLIEDLNFVHSIGDFHQNALQKWIQSDIKMNDYVEEMDETNLSKDIFAHLVMDIDSYYPVSRSDLCISSISMHPEPIRSDQKLMPCLRDSLCNKKVLKLPSIAYALSHRMLYLMLLKMTRRCYVSSEEGDIIHLDIMCANMYREAVYLARRGYFNRDLFLEHISLCGFLGYEEFHRRHWFLKAASWIDEKGCLSENYNFELNRTLIYLSKLNNSRQFKRAKKMRYEYLIDDCHSHQMALVQIVLAHGIRHAISYRDNSE